MLVASLLLAGVAVIGSPIAQAAVANRLLNPGFEVTTTPVSNIADAYDWIESYQTNGLPAKANQTKGSIWVKNASAEAHAGNYAVSIYPDEAAGATVPTLVQDIPTGYLLGRNPTIKIWWKVLAAGDQIGIKVTLKYAISTTSGGDTIGEWNTANCTSSQNPPGDTAWHQVNFSCGATLPSTLWAASLIVEPTGTFGTNKLLRVDDAEVNLDVLQTYTIPTTWTTGQAFDPLSSDDGIVGASTRYSSSGTGGQDPDFVEPELYSIKADGTGATRLTSSGFGYAHSSVNPIDRTRVVAARYTLDWDDNGSYSSTVDPARIYLIDLDEDKELPLTPEWWGSGLGGVDWTSDGRYIVFGADTGRTWELWKIDTFAATWTLTKAVTDVDSSTGAENNCYESDVSTDGFSHNALYRKGIRVDGNCYIGKQKGRIAVVDLDSSSTAGTTVWTPADEGPASTGGWPVGAYDPEYRYDDGKIIFTDVTDTTWVVATINNDGTGYSAKITDASVPTLTPGDEANWPDWRLRYIPDWHWNPAVTDSTEGLISDIEFDDQTNAYLYSGLGTYNPNDGTSYSQAEMGDVSPVEGGVKWVKFVVGGHHEATANVAPGGAGTGFDTNPTNAYSNRDSGALAVANDARDEYHTFYTWNLEKSVPAGATIDGIRVRLDDGKVEYDASTPTVKADLSWNDGTSWTSQQTVATSGGATTWTTTAQDFIGGGSADTWGRTWSQTEMDNLRVRLNFKCVTTCTFRDWKLDYINVRVYWH